MSKDVQLGRFLICSPTSDEAFELQRECNIEDVNNTIFVIGDNLSVPSLYQRMSDPSETTVEELNSTKTVSRIIIAGDISIIENVAAAKGWDDSIWSGMVIDNLEPDEVVEYRKVYPIYTS